MSEWSFVATNIMSRLRHSALANVYNEEPKLSRQTGWVNNVKASLPALPLPGKFGLLIVNIRLYSGKTGHFWPRGAPILTKLFEMV